MSQDGDESKKQKIEKKFSIQLVELAMSEELESHEIALVLGLLLKKLDLSRKKTLKFLSKCGVSDPQVLASLGDSGLLNLSPIEIIDLIATSTSNLTEYMAKIEDCLEQKLLSLSDEDTIEALVRIIETLPTAIDPLTYATRLCAQAESKRQCASVLGAFTNFMDSMQAAHFICEVIAHDFFMDLRGKMKHFLKALPRCRQEVRSLIGDYKKLDSHGEIVDSDADEHGNLRGFVENDIEDEEIEGEDGSGTEEDSDDNDSENESGSEGSSGSSSGHQRYVDEEVEVGSEGSEADCEEDDGEKDGSDDEDAASDASSDEGSVDWGQSLLADRAAARHMSGTKVSGDMGCDNDAPFASATRNKQSSKKKHRRLEVNSETPDDDGIELDVGEQKKKSRSRLVIDDE